MKNYIILLSISLIVLASAIYFKPIPNRYIFQKIDSQFASATGFDVQDTATGKIYEWITIVKPAAEGGARWLELNDVVNNKVSFLIQGEGIKPKNKIKIK